MNHDRSIEEWRSADIDHYLHPFTDYRSLAEHRRTRIITRAEGCYVWDDAGVRYLDAFAGLACVTIGYGREELAEAAARQIRDLSYSTSFFNSTNRPAIRLAEELVRLTPTGLNHVFYASSGSEANDTALRLVRRFWQLEGQPERRTVIALHHAYHGSTVAAGALSGMSSMHDQGAVIPDIVRVAPPYQFELGRGMDVEEFGRRAAGWIEDAIVSTGVGNVAAVFVEPIQGAGGGKIPPPNYLREVETICRRHDVLLVVDEVITGFGRTGSWFASQDAGLVGPDLMCLAKGITSGYIPLSAVMVGDRIAKRLIADGGEFYHGFTYSGHPVACAVALENLRILEAESIVDRVRQELAPRFAKCLQSLANHRRVGEVRSRGLMGAIELVGDHETLAAIPNADEVCEEFRNIGFSQGIIVRPIHSTVVIAPPLVITTDQIDDLFVRLKSCLDEFDAVADHVTPARRQR